MSLAAFNELLLNMFGKIQHENKYAYIFKDFNVNIMPDLKSNVNIQDLKNIFSSNYCRPVNTKPTGVTNTCASLIDNIYSNVCININNCDSGISEASISDHYAFFCLR